MGTKMSERFAALWARRPTIRLAEGWQRLHRSSTVIVSTTAAGISAFGPQIREAWRSIPDDIKSMIPAHAQQAVAWTIFFCVLVGLRYTVVELKPKGSGDAANQS